MITKVFVVPPSNHYAGDRLFDQKSSLNRDGSLEPFINLKKILYRNNVKLQTIDKAGIEEFDDQCVILFFGSTLDLTYKYLDYKCKHRFFFFLEPFLVKPDLYQHFYNIAGKFKTVFVARAYHSYITNDTTIKDLNWPYQNRFGIYQDILQVASSRCRKCLSIIGSHVSSARVDNGYGLRLLVLSQTLSRNFFVVYGSGWSWFPRIRHWPSGIMLWHYFKIKKHYKPKPVVDKISEMTKYDFALVIENEFASGFHTEKLFDALSSGAIPIYKGDPEILELVPGECLILLDDFGSIDEVVEMCLAMSEEEIKRRRKIIVEFIGSHKFQNICNAFISDVYSCVN